MPKTKTHSGAKKRFRMTARGKIKARHAMLSHNTGKKGPKRKRRLSRPVDVARPDRKRVKELMRS
jgi:large subunit ribosomal protein L35